MGASLPPFRHQGDPPASAGSRFRRSLRQLLVVAVVLAGMAMAAGWWFGQADQPRAARLLLGERVEREPEQPAGEPGPDRLAPTSGATGATPACGRRTDPVPPQAQADALAAGTVILQHDPGLAPAEVERLAGLVEHGRVLLAPLGAEAPAAVIATAWRHRLALDEVERDTLATFITGWQGRGPDPAPCDGGDRH